MSKTTINGDIHVQGELTKSGESVLVETSLFPSFNTATSYYVGMIVTHLGSLYRCKTTAFAGEWDAAKWDLISTADVMGFKRIPAPSSSILTAYQYEDFKHGVVIDGTYLGFINPVFTPTITPDYGSDMPIGIMIGVKTGTFETIVCNYWLSTGYPEVHIAETQSMSFGAGSFKIRGKTVPTYPEDTTKSYALEQNASTGNLAWNEKIGTYVSTTYADLKSLRDNSQLVPGTQYRITDFVTTTTQADTSSAGHQFDLIVVADSTSKLNEQARAILHEGDTYFANSKLEAWQIWYSLDNDATRFAWADVTNGKGVIYRLIDEWGNDVPYDFKNIIYEQKRSFTMLQAGSSYAFVRDSSLDADGYYGWRTSSGTPIGWPNPYCFTTSVVLTTSTILSIDTTGQGVPGPNCDIVKVSNVEGNYYTFCIQQASGYVDTTLTNAYNIRNNVIKGLKDGTTLNANIFKNNNCYDNVLGYGSYENTFGNSAHDIVLGNFCHNNSFSSANSSIVFGDYCYNNYFGGNSYYIKLGNSCHDNEVASGMFLQHAEFGEDCSYNVFRTITFYARLGMSCSHNSIDADYFIFDDNCSYINLSGTTSSAQNVHIHIGVHGTSSNNMLAIAAPDLPQGSSRSIDYYASNSQEVYL